MKLLEIKSDSLVWPSLQPDGDFCYSFQRRKWVSMRVYNQPCFGWFYSTQEIIARLNVTADDLKSLHCPLKDKFFVIMSRSYKNEYAAKVVQKISFIVTDDISSLKLDSVEIIDWRVDLV